MALRKPSISGAFYIDMKINVNDFQLGNSDGIFEKYGVNFMKIVVIFSALHDALMIERE